MNIKGGRLDEGYAKLANQIYEGKIKNVQQLTQESSDFVIGHVVFRSTFETVRVGAAKLARYYLGSLENTALKENPEFILNDDAIINLENVMPDSISDAWKHIDQQDIQTHRSRLGNLALLLCSRWRPRQRAKQTGILSQTCYL